MKAILLVLAAAGVLAAGVGYAQSGADVAKSKCAACHDVDKKKVGPSFKDIAAKYKGKKEAEGKLVGAMKEGKVYNFAFAVHDDNITTRGHQISFPIKVGFGAKAAIEATKLK